MARAGGPGTACRSRGKGPAARPGDVTIVVAFLVCPLYLAPRRPVVAGEAHLGAGEQIRGLAPVEGTATPGSPPPGRRWSPRGAKPGAGPPRPRRRPPAPHAPARVSAARACRVPGASPALGAGPLPGRGAGDAPRAASRSPQPRAPTAPTWLPDWSRTRPGAAPRPRSGPSRRSISPHPAPAPCLPRSGPGCRRRALTRAGRQRPRRAGARCGPRPLQPHHAW